MRRAELRLTKGGKSRWNLAFAAMRAALLLSSLTVACAPSVPKVSFWPSANVAPRRGPTASSSSSREALVIGAIAGAACAAVAAIGSTKRKVHYNASSSDAGGPKFYKPPQYSKDDEESDTAEVYPSDLEEDIEEPVFQSDFLLVQLPGVPLALHSVCGHALLSTATYEHLRFSTVEYTHTQQEGFAGLWGTFAKTENQTYNPQDKKSGTKFIRHAGIGRDHVVVYNVQVFVDHSYDEKPLRVSVESLKQLARARPNEFAMPDSIPTSHGQQRPADDSSEEEDDDESSSEDPPPPIPHGFVAYAWQEGSSVNEFLLWSKLRGQRNPTWHRGLVDKILDPNRAGGFTHNAKFDGEPHPRGTTLTAAAVDEGVLVLMRPAVAAPAPAQAPAAARRQRPRR